MKWIFNTGCGCLLLIPTYFVVHDIVVYGLNIWKVHTSCKETRVPEIYNKAVWDKWTDELARSGRLVGMDWSKGATDEQARLLKRLTSKSHVFLKKVDIFPYDYPYHEIMAPTAELHFRGELFASLITYNTSDTFLPEVVRVAGFNRQLSCGKEYTRIYSQYSSRQFNPAIVRLEDDSIR